MAKKISHHVVPRQAGWAVKKTTASRASKVFGCKTEAVKYAQGQAKKEHSELYVHRSDGTIAKHNSYGKDTGPPKGKK